MIDPLAVIDSRAHLDESVSIGPFAVIGANVEIGPGCKIGPHTVIDGPTRIGRDNRIYSHAAIGGDPQDKKYKGGDARLEIGDGNVIREYCSISRGTSQDKGVTRIGDHNWIMAYVHIAHDCVVGNNTIFANNATLAGHVQIEDNVNLGGFTLVQQFCKIGAYAFTGMGTAINKDVAPYVIVNGNPARVRSINTEGLRRGGFDTKAIQYLKKAYKTLFRSDLTLEESIQGLKAQASDSREVAYLLDFLEQHTRGIIR